MDSKKPFYIAEAWWDFFWPKLLGTAIGIAIVYFLKINGVL